MGILQKIFKNKVECKKMQMNVQTVNQTFINFMRK